MIRAVLDLDLTKDINYGSLDENLRDILDGGHRVVYRDVKNGKRTYKFYTSHDLRSKAELIRETPEYAGIASKLERIAEIQAQFEKKTENETERVVEQKPNENYNGPSVIGRIGRFKRFASKAAAVIGIATAVASYAGLSSFKTPDKMPQISYSNEENVSAKDYVAVSEVSFLPPIEELLPDYAPSFESRFNPTGTSRKVENTSMGIKETVRRSGYNFSMIGSRVLNIFRSTAERTRNGLERVIESGRNLVTMAYENSNPIVTKIQIAEPIAAPVRQRQKLDNKNALHFPGNVPENPGIATTMYMTRDLSISKELREVLDREYTAVDLAKAEGERIKLEREAEALLARNLAETNRRMQIEIIDSRELGTPDYPIGLALEHKILDMGRKTSRSFLGGYEVIDLDQIEETQRVLIELAGSAGVDLELINWEEYEIKRSESGVSVASK